jgi:cell division protein FtsB
MNSKRLHLVLVATLVLLFIGLLGGAYGINKLLASEANKLTALKAKNLALGQEQLSLNKAKKDIKTYDNLDKIAQDVVPQDKNQAEAVREIVNIAAANDVSLAAINFPASTLGVLPNGTAPAATSGTASPAAAGGNTKAAGLSQLVPVKNIPGIYQLPITVNGNPNQPVQYEKFINFLSDLEHNRRTAQVGTITIQPDPVNRDYLTFTLTLSEYIKP